MRMRVLALLVGFMGVAHAETGVVAGKVSLKGGSEAWVYVEDLVTPLPSDEAQRPVAKMFQKDKGFAPRVLVVTRGTKVEVPNADPIFHNVFSVTAGSTFDLGSYPRGQSRSVTMVRAGQVNVFCNIHPQMIGYILITPGPNVVKAAADGSYRLEGLPPGKHRVTAWAPDTRRVTQEVEVAADKPAEANFTLEPGAVRTHLRKDGTPYGSYGE